ncbi:TrmH family RNA methyltransferase [Anaerotignum sp. MB30-C6]|uniref:TrmH family RNA methyltransferase n=1 Tax=Anaerotignum sp. MB30-C6 TaxID=3070814 RepID=UPI0027DC7A2C|nr:RNA methyltransferase [Anaerotignum sp. MB30-C6]WMI81995.1 RNA methyltransferase [Anaerotignum sp. MB30-C6]
MAKKLESHQNKVFKRVKGFSQKKNRDKEGVFVAEGLRFVSEIPNNWEVELFVVSQDFAGENDLGQYEDRADTYLLTNELFSLLSDTENPQGILAVCKKQKECQEAIWKKDAPFLVLAEELNDPGNLGTVIRTADAAGADGIFLSKGSVDVYNPKVLRATMGSIFHIPVYQNISLEEIAWKMQENQISLYAAHLKGDCYPYELPLEKGCGFLIGNEARGLSDEAAELCNRWAKIPMPGKAESLNASIAAGVLMYEIVRQRLK